MECLDEDAVLAFVEGTTDPGRRSDVELHLAECASCADLVASAAGGTVSAGDLPAAPAADPLQLPRGSTVGRYIVLELVGRGGMGEVYAAYDPQLDRRVALKLLHETQASGDLARAARERLLREAKAIARLNHPNVVVVHDAGAITDDDQRGGRVFLAMEFVEGETLADWLADRPRSWREIREVFVAAAEGLAAAHRAGLVHRDFKPQNVMVGGDGAVRVMDFGLATDAAADHARPGDQPGEAPGDDLSRTVTLTRTGALLGTPLYMSPEQLQLRPTDARTDQFSFCVALYEAVYGARPFPGESFAALYEAVVGGRLREPPQKARVPSFLRRLLGRGLAVDPESRFPSMEALLEELRYDPGRRRRSIGRGAAAVVLALAVVVGGQRIATRGQRMCRSAGDRLAGIWEVGTAGERRESVHRAFLATGAGFAEQTWNRVSALLDDYGRHWNALYTDTCEATHVRGDQSAEVLDLRMSCLEGARGALKALTAVFARADRSVVVEAINGANALPPLERCSDLPALQAPLPPPRDPAVRARLTELRTKLAEVKAWTDTGQSAKARQQMEALLGAATALDYEPLTAEVLSAHAWLEGQSGSPADAVRVLEKVALSGLAAHRDDIAVEAVAGLVGYDGYYLGRTDESNRWVEIGEALLRRLGPGHERIASWFYQDRAIARERHGEYAAALADLELALALKEKVLPAKHPDLALTLHTMANVYNEMGRPTAALEVANRAVDVDQSAYGPDSPLQTKSLLARGETLSLLGRQAEAERDLRRATDLSAAWVGPDHPWTAYALTGLGKTLLAEGRWREATRVLRRALRIRQASEPNAESVAETEFALARALSRTDGEQAAAKELGIAARDAYRRLPNHEKQTQEIETWLRLL